jgi:Bacterial extracellular solute-binding protein
VTTDEPQATKLVMQRRTFIKTSAAITVPASMAVGASPNRDCGELVVWKAMVLVPAGVPALNGYTDTVPDIVGRLGSPIGLAIFTEGNHFPALLSGEIIEPFRAWARGQAEHAALVLDNIVVVTLPQPMIVDMLLGHGISMGNLTLEVSRASGFYPDLVMGGTAPLTQLHKASIVEAEARVFARNRGLSLVVRAGNPRAIKHPEDLTRSGIRVVMATENEPGARNQYIAALDARVGPEATRSILAHEAVSFPGRLGIQHRDVPQAVAQDYADVGVIFHHLARYYAAAYPGLYALVTVPGAERFSSTIGMASAVDPLRAHAARAFSEFFFGVAREVYPRYGFVTISEAEFGTTIRLTSVRREHDERGPLFINA